MGKKPIPEFAGKNVLITGGSSGIGYSAAGAFLSAGADVWILGRNSSRLKTAGDGLSTGFESYRTRPGQIHTIAADVSVPRECERAVSELLREAGTLDVLVNSAGIYAQEPSREVDEVVWNRIVDTNLKGTFFMCRYSIPALEKTEGCIVNIASDSGITGNDEAAVYCASKGGVVLLTKSLAVELARVGIRVNAVCPGIVETPMVAKDFAQSGFSGREEYNRENLRSYPRGTRRFVKPEEVAQSILFLASGSKAGGITGACLSVDQGLTAGY